MSLEQLKSSIATLLTDKDLDTTVQTLNELKMFLKSVSPFKNEPIDCVIWVKGDQVSGNDYNPNSVAPPEMRLLECSIAEDGYTQPIVAWPNEEKFEIIDGFHRHRVGKEAKDISARIHGYLPLTVVNKEKTGKAERIASTIRHNRARGKHSVDAMSEIVLELKNRNWKNSRIARELGMDEEEILRLTQISGLEHMFVNEDFSKAWLADGAEIPEQFKVLTDRLDDEEVQGFRTINTSDPERVFHTYDKWECHKAGFYATFITGLTKDQAEQKYANFLSDDQKFRNALSGVVTEWTNSCEHYLTNRSMNRIAYLGQAAACYSEGLPAKYRGGFFKMTEEQQNRANITALEYLNLWLSNRGKPPVTLDEAVGGVSRQVSIY